MQHDIIQRLEALLYDPSTPHHGSRLGSLMLIDGFQRNAWRFNMYTWSVFPMGNLNLSDDEFKDLRGKYLAYRFYEHKSGFEHGPLFDTWEEAEQWCQLANAAGHGERDA